MTAYVTPSLEQLEEAERSGALQLQLGDVAVVDDVAHVLVWRVPGRELGWVESPTWPEPLSTVLRSGDA